ncbi:MAG: tetratricopeptide repeat protein [Deltaproteobacteria bacterium]|nr:tetratricopeptide repeat protein [Deltaproteobacteria bacterium]
MKKINELLPSFYCCADLEHRSGLCAYVLAALLLSGGYGGSQAFAQDANWNPLPTAREAIKGHLPKYNSNAAAVNHLILGVDQLENNELHAARQNFLFIINLKDDAPALGGLKLKHIAYSNLGVVDSLEGNSNGAIRNFLAALELDPQYSEAHFNIGTVYYKIGNLKKAEEAFLKAIEIEPNYGRAYYSLGFLYFDQKRYDLARKQSEKAIEYGVPFKTLREKLAKVGR